ncbi:MAG TPA: class I tRNA ligase family protein, partial [Patescibacteria group bacterium]|nr:class I tRNA ligase family protein [Patescibacteria group bacterium]
HDGTLNHLTGRFEGMTVMEARKAVVEALEEKGLLVKVDKNYKNRIGKCYKCGTIIEPMLMEQWFVDMQPLAERAIKVLETGEITFYPDSKREQLIGYLNNLRDWNISRQIAWGIPIPAFQNVDDSDDWIFDDHVTEEIIEIDGKTYRRDPDVFDTWFSSSSWPYATLGYPDDKDFKKHYPLSLMETGGEILYPWVSRMIMLGLYVTDQIPFKAVYIHGYVMAEDGSKMSKSIGNVVNAPEVIEKYGADALRMGIIAGRVPAVNRGYDVRKIEDARNFCNKLWNIARYIEDKVGDVKKIDAPEPKTSADHWVLSQLGKTITSVTKDLDNYRFAEAYDTLYHFIWDDFADWYIEASKAQENTGVLAYTLQSILMLLHPFAPFVTETIWQTLVWAPDSLLAVSEWPTAPETDKKQTNSFEEIKAIVAEARAIMKAVGVTKTSLLYDKAPVLAANEALVCRLAHLTSVSESPAPVGVKLAQTKHEVRLAISDKDAAAYVEKLVAKREEQAKVIGQLQGRLKNKSYVDNAPKAIVEQTRAQLTEAESQLDSLKHEMLRFGS